MGVHANLIPKKKRKTQAATDAKLQNAKEAYLGAVAVSVLSNTKHPEYSHFARQYGVDKTMLRCRVLGGATRAEIAAESSRMVSRRDPNTGSFDGGTIFRRSSSNSLLTHPCTRCVGSGLQGHVH